MRSAAMTFQPDSVSLILELEARQDDALRRLVELDERIEAVLKAALPSIAPPALWQADPIEISCNAAPAATPPRPRSATEKLARS